MEKILKIGKILLFVFSVIIIFILVLKNEQIAFYLNLPKWIIPSLFSLGIFYMCYRYILFILKKDKIEKEIISIVNHTFRTPLTSATWYLKELEKDMSQNEKLTYLENINNSIGKVLNIVDLLAGIKDIKNRSGYFFEATSIREIIEKSIKKYSVEIKKKNLTLQVSSFKNVPLLTIDLKKITFVIDAILENAIYYTKQDGQILIDSISDYKKITFYLKDSGIGLTTIDKMMLFSKFYRNKIAKLMYTDGMGLKLYLSKQIIKRHHGKIYAKSNGPDQGTIFFIELPFRK